MSTQDDLARVKLYQITTKHLPLSANPLLLHHNGRNQEQKCHVSLSFEIFEQAYTKGLLTFAK